MKEINIILHNIRSTHNVGSIFRSADAFNVTKIYLTGYTPSPLDRFGRVQKDIAKTALGAESCVAWEQSDIRTLIETLRADGFTIASIEQDSRAQSLYTYKPQTKIAIILGNEVRGVSKQIRDKSDVIIEIPMLGQKESLNVSVSAGITLFQLRK